jgi:amidohydrolase
MGPSPARPDLNKEHVLMVKAPTRNPAASRPATDRKVPLLMQPRGSLTRAELVALRRDIHRHPELGFEERRTSAVVQTHLRALGLSPKVLAGTGVVSLIESTAPGKTLMLRSDLDGLPIREENTYPFKSENDGVMHACGHDFHASILLGTAKTLVQEPPARGRVKLNFQPAEEGLNGAGAMIRDGLMESPKVDAVLGYHIWQELPVGKVGVVTGPCMAAVDRFRVTVRGKGGHAAYPQRSVDPVLLAAHAVTALQSIVSRNVSALDSAVVTVGQLHAGTAFNIIPPEASLEGTVRTFSKEAGKLIPKRFREIVTGTVKALGGTAEIEYVREHEATVNDPAMADFMREVVRDVLGKKALVHAEPSMGGEDHSAYQALVPGCYTFLGAGTTRGEVFPHHHPRFNPDEGVLEPAVAVMSEAARRWLARN